MTDLTNGEPTANALESISYIPKIDLIVHVTAKVDDPPHEYVGFCIPSFFGTLCKRAGTGSFPKYDGAEDYVRRIEEAHKAYFDRLWISMGGLVGGYRTMNPQSSIWDPVRHVWKPDTGGLSYPLQKVEGEHVTEEFNDGVWKYKLYLQIEAS